MSYPLAPWNLQGFSLQSLHVLDVERVRPYLPTGLQVFSVLPGKTLGGVYAAAYGQGSVLEYNELIVVGALVWAAGKIGSWISHIYVDNPDSVAGGREIWGLPKQMADFTWNLDKTLVHVKQNNQLLCTLSSKWQLPGWQQALKTPPVFSLLHSKLQRFEARAEFKLQLTDVDVTVPPESPFAELNLGRPWLGFYANPIRLTVEAPIPINQDKKEEAIVG